MIHIKEDIADLKPHVIQLRRQLHQIPEPGFFEEETTSLINESLKSLGIETKIAVPGTGVIGFLKGNHTDKTIAFRADIDALSVEEQTGVNFCSKKNGFMHACGHDGHTAILLGFAKYMAEHRVALKHNILFIFQPAEEGPGGAEPIVNSGILKEYNVSHIFGLHIYPEIEEGKVGCRSGAMMAQTGEFDIKIIGRSGHGAMPHKASDAMIAAVHTVTALNTIVSRNIDPIEPAVLTVGRMISGERRNIIAGEAVLEGTMRAFNQETYSTIRSRLIKIAEGIPDAFNCQMQYEIRDMYPAVTNNDALYKLLVQIVKNEDFVQLAPLTISEDFSYYQQQIPGLFFMLGSRNEGLNYHYPLHSNRFNFNEDIMITGIQLFYDLYMSL